MQPGPPALGEQDSILFAEFLNQFGRWVLQLSVVRLAIAGSEHYRLVVEAVHMLGTSMPQLRKLFVRDLYRFKPS